MSICATPLSAAEQQACDWLEQQQDKMEARLWQLANINSGSYNLDGLAQVAETLVGWAEPLNCEIG
ncbi:MAG: hypothetical protein QF872_06025, partial [Gammaproteobacteria bacterium]|nr:hypothetical protein [Gammaproteobacteria bacterium]